MGKPLKSAVVDLRRKLNAKKKAKNVTKVKTGCHYCGGNHMIRNCVKLLKFSVVERRLEVAAKNLCTNCLIPIDGKHACKFGPCKVCGGFEFHNSILCFLAVR